MMKSQQIMKKDFNDCSSSENPNIYSSKLENKYFAKIQQIQNSQNLKSYKQITHLIKSENIVNGIIESQPAESKSSKLNNYSIADTRKCYKFSIRITNQKTLPNSKSYNHGEKHELTLATTRCQSSSQERIVSDHLI